MTYGPHGVKVERQIVHRIQNARQRLCRHVKMSQISARVTRTNPASASGIGRRLVLSETRILDVDSSLRRKEKAVARRARGQHAIHHVHAHGRVLYDLLRISHTHDVAWPVLWQYFQ